MAVDVRRVERIVSDLLDALGQDVQREGLQDTPRRVARWWSEFLDYDPGNVGTTFESIQEDQMVIVTGMRVWSLCEHHLLPFWCDVSIGYITGDRVLGLSKMARIAHYHAHKLQVQERLVGDIARDVAGLAGTEDVAVLASGEHLCMTMRGIRTPGIMKSSYMGGVFREKDAVRQEFLALAAGSRV